MRKNTRYLVHAAIIAALYAVLTHLQNLLFPGTATMAIQFRASEALCVLAFFTPAAVGGLSIGCFLFNLLSGATPMDFIVGSLASFLAAWSMWKLRRLTIKGYPLPGLLMPPLFNAILVGWELTVYFAIGGSFWLNAAYVAIGELAVLLTLGSGLYYAIRSRHLQHRLF
ncbi:MAG: QueT transporter family protein [Oscillospiraceae bacterium]|nr:QueT transporter family protein [Oscillospiraceae bacterium]